MSAVRDYALAVGLVAIALGLGLAAEAAGLQNLEMVLFLMAIAGAVWHLGQGPGIPAILLAALAFNYFFTEPRYSLYMQPSDAAHFVAFLAEQRDQAEHRILVIVGNQNPRLVHRRILRRRACAVCRRAAT